MTALVILLHGVGSRGADLAGLAGALGPRLPGAAFASPDAPFAFDQGGAGRQWFSVRGVTEANRPERVRAARAAFDQTVQGLVEGHGLAGSLRRVALVGFSQGSIMALDALASGRWPVGAIVAFSGRLASPEPLTPAPETRTLLIHGDADPVMPVGESEKAETALRRAGADVRRRTLPRLGHAISPEGAALATDVLAEALAGAAA
ncbi:phospholipase [Methylopila jiangsuensis]|uniref:Phospholipase n=1 Tax=Methylopila jiangsuensis TaxID=586230 RepID=A0A9W6JI73_9HYPH|nr:prolyl oligopeptidase family serine peptidase [Methylopila jiangsuensis]MDR6284925.1 phospholipase/carboxylesterase [Methylopila jiangsuensis]GLK77687.1 phospholipase [Methylopila jiangsuensis]